MTNRITAIVLAILMAVGLVAQYVECCFAGEVSMMAGLYIVNIKTDDNVEVNLDEPGAEEFKMPDLSVREGYEIATITADQTVGGHDAGYCFNAEEVTGLTADDFGADTLFTITSARTEGAPAKSSNENVPDDAAESADDAPGSENSEVQSDDDSSENEQEEILAKASELEEAVVPEVLYDQYDKLPANFVSIETDLRVEEAEAVNNMTGVKLVYGYPGSGTDTKRYFYSYYGTVTYGKSNRTTTADAVTKKNTINGSLSLTWRDKATLSDGEKADVRVTISDVYCNIGKCTSANIKDTAKVYLPIIGNATNGRINVLQNTPRVNIDTNSDSDKYVTGATCQSRRKVRIEILKDGNPIDRNKYPCMLLGVSDLDGQDHSIASGKSRREKYNGIYAEGITMINGWYSPVVLAPKSSPNKAMQTLVNTRLLDNLLNIKGDGDKYQAFIDATGMTNDSNTFYSGFAAACNPQDVSFYWHASNGTTGDATTTIICGHPTVAVKGQRITIDSKGNTINQDGGILKRVDGEELVDDVSDDSKYRSKTYAMNSTVTYSYEPKPGFRVVSLKVDDEDVEFNPEGGDYVFTRLNKNILSERDASTGAVLGASASSYYSIDVVYEKIPAESDLTISKNVAGNLGDVSKEFRFNIQLAKLDPDSNYVIKVNGDARIDKAATGKLEEADASGYQSFVPAEDGNCTLDMYMKDDSTVTIEDLPEGATYKVGESPSDHVASYKLSGADNAVFASEEGGNSKDNTELSTKLETVDEADGNVTVAFTNTRNIAVVSGVADDGSLHGSLLAILLMMSGAYALIMAIFRRKRRKTRVLVNK